MTGHHPFSKLREAMSSERQAANAAATQKAIAEVTADGQVTRLTPADGNAFGNWLIANEGKLPDDFELNV